METIANRRKKNKSNFVDLSTLSVDDFMNSALNGLGDSGDSDVGDINNGSASNDVTRAMIGDQQEEGICLHRVLVFIRRKYITFKFFFVLSSNAVIVFINLFTKLYSEPPGNEVISHP